MRESATPSPRSVNASAGRSWRHRLGIGVWRADQQSEGYLFLLPSLIGFTLFVVFPIIASLALSFYRWDLLTSAEFIGVENYVELATTDPLMGRVLANTFFYMVTIAPLQLIIGFILALALNSGLHGIIIHRDGSMTSLSGGADPRREGDVKAD